MRPNPTQRVAVGGWFLTHLAARKFCYAIVFGVAGSFCGGSYLLAQQQPATQLRPNQPQVISGPGRTGQVQEEPQSAPSDLTTYPSQAWTRSNMPPLPNSPTDQVVSDVVTAAYSPPIRSAENTSALLGQAPTAEPTAKERTPLARRAKSPADDTKTTGSGGTLQMLVSVGSSLLIVIGLFLGVAWCYRKTLNQSSLAVPQQVVKVLGRTPLAPRQQLLVVRFGSKLLLVSLVQGEARTLSEITDPLEVDQLAGICESSQPGSISASFRSILNQGGATA